MKLSPNGDTDARLTPALPNQLEELALHSKVIVYISFVGHMGEIFARALQG